MTDLMVVALQVVATTTDPSVDPSIVWEWANKLGAVGAFCLILFIIGLKRYWWRMGSDCKAEIAALEKQLEDVRADRDLRLAESRKEASEWKAMAMDFGGMTQQAVKLAAMKGAV